MGVRAAFLNFGEEFVGREDHLSAIEFELRASAEVEGAVQLAAASVEDWNYEFRARGIEGKGLRGDCFERANSNDWLAVNLGPGFGGSEPDAQAGEGTGAGGNRKQIEIGEIEGEIAQQKFEMAEQARGVIFVGSGGNDTEQGVVTEDGEAADEGRGVQCKG